MSARMVPYHCPYCADEDLRPHGQTHGAWECRSCLRAFSLKFLGQLTPTTTTPTPAPLSDQIGSESHHERRTS